MQLMALALLVLVSLIPSYAQDVERVRTGAAADKVKQSVDFHFLHADIDTTTTNFVATYRCTAKNRKSGIENLYEAIQQEAKKDGANAFRLVSFHQSESDPDELTIDAYFASEEVIAESTQKKDHNVVFVFFEDRKTPSGSMAFRIGDKRKVLRSGQFFVYPLSENDQVKISKGGTSNLWLSGGSNRPATYVSLTEFGTGQVSQPLRSSGRPSNTNKIYTIDKNLGELLTRVFDRVE